MKTGKSFFINLKLGEGMSKKRPKNQKNKQSAREKSDEISEEALDFLVRAMLTPKTVALLLQDKAFVKGALNETRKAKQDKEDIQGLGVKYSVSSESVEEVLGDVEEIFTKILGDPSGL